MPDVERIFARVLGELGQRLDGRVAEMHRRFDRLELAMREIEPRAPDVEP